MKIEIEIPDYIDKKLLNEELITEMKISAYIPLIEKSEMSEAAVARLLDISRWVTSDYFAKIHYTGFLKVDMELENDPKYKKNSIG